jgi:hypothetical protein
MKCYEIFATFDGIGIPPDAMINEFRFFIQQLDIANNELLSIYD